MNLYAHNFWGGFFDKTNPGHIQFFLDLFKLVFDQEIYITHNVYESDILLETVFSYDTCLFIKPRPFKYTFLFSGESRLNNFHQHYDCILSCSRNHDNYVNTPLFIYYLYNSNLDLYHKNKTKITSIPPLDFICIVSNPNSIERNYILDELDKHFNISYGGTYKNNINQITYVYNTPEFREIISRYKFIISLENSKNDHDTYITEKITHGLLSNTIPIYWGSQLISNYINPERFINIQNYRDLDNIINKIKYLLNNPDEYLKIINQDIKPDNKNIRTIQDISRDIKNIIFRSDLLQNNIDRIYVLSNPEYEPDRYSRLVSMFDSINISNHVKYVSPTYKHTITDQDMKDLIREDLVIRVRPDIPMRRAEISLFLNYKYILQEIVDNYKEDSIFMIFESDVYIKYENINKFKDFLTFVKNLDKKSWDLIHIGGYIGQEDVIFKTPYECSGMIYRGELSDEYKNMDYIEDITSITDQVRLIRRFNTRCCDSFLWNYQGIVKFLNHMNTDTNYGAPFDYYMTNYLENNKDFKHYWTDVMFFYQGSNMGIIKSTIKD